MTPREAAIREKAIQRAGEIIAAGLARRDSMTAREAAWTPTGPSVDELERLIRLDRGLQAKPDEAPEPTRSMS